ncbi:MAG: phenylalanine--tRNA ligase subunit beta [Clostridiales bacterium]|nr:phenylalanine--tRNA ligase subunit beta [Clostridiales bacterium]
MKLPISWLNEYVSTEGVTPNELADKLLNAGFEVEEIIQLGSDIKGVVTGKILDMKKHIDADKLQVCMVDIGNEITTIVTGATNIKQGDIVPVATNGANLPGNIQITATSMRGVMSYGMMCSGKELGVDDTIIAGAEVNGILILPPDTPVGTDIREILRMNECILDISVTANRPDCQSIYGMAREVAAILGKKLKPLNLKYRTVPATHKPKVRVESDACSRYTCQEIINVKIQKSPEWMRDRLRYVGVRAINNIVDITNYVLFEVGQPLHAFDTAVVEDLSIVVRYAKEGEEITALDGKVYAPNTKTTLITDPKKALAIAGIMGGEYSGISDSTKSVLLEAARFRKDAVRASSRALGLRSDSSARYEKGVDYISVDTGRNRALALISQLKAGAVTDAFAEGGETEVKPKKIVTSVQKICDLLGIEIKQSVIVKILKSLEFGVEAEDGKLTVTVPLFREDVDNYTDLAEEVIRFYGYDNIESTFFPTAKPTAGGEDVRGKNLRTLKSLAIAFGAYEICTYSFIGKKALDKLCIAKDDVLRRQIEILNPLGEEYSLMRTQLAANMLSVVSFNISRKNRDFRLFEMAKTYLPHDLPLTELPEEHDTLCVAFAGANESFYGIKAMANEIFRRFGLQPTCTGYATLPYYHPGISCEYALNGNRFCALGKIHPTVAKNYDLPEDVYLLEMDASGFIGIELPVIKRTPLPKFPSVARDLAVVVKEEVPVGTLIQTVKSVADVESAELFDIYRGTQIEEGYKSVALSFKLIASDHTLTEEEINASVKQILHALAQNCAAQLR